MIINNRPSGGCSYIVDQGWSLHVGSVRLARWRRCYADARSPSLQPARFWSLSFSARAALGAGVTCLCMFAATSLIVERVGAKPTYAVTVPVPPSTPRRLTMVADHLPTVRPAPATPAARPRVSVTPVTAVTKTDQLAVVSTPPAVGHSLVLTLGEGEADLQPSTKVSQASAIKNALTTGETQEWRETASGLDGFVVAGPLQEDGGRQCRAMAILTRSTDGNVVEKRRDCLPLAQRRPTSM